MLAVEWVLNQVLVNLEIQMSSVLTLLPGLSELVGASRGIGARANNSLPVAGHGGKEIGRGLTLRTDEAEAFKVGLCLVSATEKDLSTLIQDDDFVKDLHHMVSTAISEERRNSCSGPSLHRLISRTS